MARTKGCWRRRRHRFIVVSLPVQNPTAIGRQETTVEPAAGVTTRKRIAAALPEEILVWEIFVRLPAKHILRCGAVCRSWRGLTSAPDFLLAHHRHQPSFPLLTLYGPGSTDGDLPIIKHSRPLLRLADYNGFKVLASCDGLLLLSFSMGRFSICNPTTRQHAPLPRLTAAGRISIAALYLHHPSGKYRVLYWKGKQWGHLKAAYYILTVRRRPSPRCIGVPSDIPGIVKIMLDWHETASNLAPPVVFRNCLHWDLGCSPGILVFDTVVETFRRMRSPAAATPFDTCLCDMEGSIGFSCNDNCGRTVKIWVLEDHQREVWSFKYHVELPLDRFSYLAGHTQHLVLSHKGDVLAYRSYEGCMFHCDRTGEFLEGFQYDSPSSNIIGHWFKESLVKHDIFLRRGSARVSQRV